MNAHNAHEEFEDRIEASLAGGLSASEREAFERHGAGCPSCGSALSAAREFSRFMKEALMHQRPPADLEDRLISSLRAEGMRPKRRWLRFPPIPTGTKAAAAALLAVGIGALANAPVEAMRTMRMGQRASSGALDLPQNAVGVRRNQPSLAKEPLVSTFIAVENLDITPGDFGCSEKETNLTLRFGGSRSVKAPAEELRKQKQSQDQGGGGIELFHTAPEDGRKIIRNATLDVEVESFETAAREINRIVAQVGGFVSGSSSQKLANGKIKGIVTVRIPSMRYDEAMASLRALGEVKNQAVNTQDVTKQYVDLDARLKNKRTLEERLTEILKKSKGSVKELLEVEQSLGKVREEIEQIQGELKYYDNLVNLSTVTLSLSEKEIGQPFEYVQKLKSELDLVAEDASAAHQKAQEAVRSAGGKILDAGMTRNTDGSATGKVQASVDADRYPAVVDQLKGLGEVTRFVENRQQQAMGGQEGKTSDTAPLRKEQARLDISIKTPPEVVAATGDLLIEARDVPTAYDAARSSISDAAGKVSGGGVTRHSDGATGTLTLEFDAARLPAVLAKLKGLGEVKSESVRQEELPKNLKLRRERAKLALTLRTPPRIVESEQGAARLVHKTLSGSVAGLAWSARMFFVGAAYLAPWAALFWIGRKLWRARKKAPLVGEKEMP